MGLFGYPQRVDQEMSAECPQSCLEVTTCVLRLSGELVTDLERLVFHVGYHCGAASL